MRWRKYTVYTTVEAEDLVSLCLSELGAGGVEIEDNVPPTAAELERMYVDIPCGTGPDDGRSKLSFYLGEEWDDAKIAALIEDLRAGLREMASRGVDIGEARIEEGETDETDWRDRWKEFYEPFTVGSFLIKPSFRDIPEEMATSLADRDITMIEIDPGAAFGTGTHETTRLCLEAIEEYLSPGDSVLDIGTGSGILGIAALKKGAARVAATELDQGTKDTIEANLAFNDISADDFRLIYANVIADDLSKGMVRTALGGDGEADLVLSNILSPVIERMAQPGEVDTLVRPGGIWVMSGILSERADEVLSAVSQNPSWEIIDVRTMGEWCLAAARRMGDTERVIRRGEHYLKKRDKAANKSTYGRLLVIAGSKGMAGAAYLSGLGAFRSGIGMVRYLGPEANRVILQTLLPEAMYESFDPFGGDAADRLKEALSGADAMILGPGLSQSDEARKLMHLIFSDQCLSPVRELKLKVIDADALNIIAQERLPLFLLGKNTVITPHVMEMTRLLNAFLQSGDKLKPGDIKKDPAGYAGIARDIFDVNVILKDSVTFVSLCSGVTYRADAGTPAMAKAGSGDILTGIIAGTAAVTGWDLSIALPLGVHLHGRAGKAAAEQRGIHSILASDIAHALS